MKKTKLLAAMTLLAGGVLVSITSKSLAPEKPCNCPHVYAPVCIVETGQRFTNSCFAQCAGHSPDEFVECDFQ